MDVTDFQKKVAEYIAGDDKRVEELARAFGCALSTVTRWAGGVSEPHPVLRALIFDWIKGIR